MFHPAGHPLERGWVGRVEKDRVVHLAAQTLPSFFTGGGSAREHAEYPRDEVVLLAPILHPPSVRLFEEQDVFSFANPAAIVGPDATIARPNGSHGKASPGLVGRSRLAAVIATGSEIGGFTICVEWRAEGLEAPKDRDFALGLGPVVVTPEAAPPGDGFDWAAAVALAAANTTLYPGDLLAGPVREEIPGAPGSVVEVEIDGIGVLAQRIAA